MREDWSLSACLHLLLTILGWQVLAYLGLYLAGSVLEAFLPAGFLADWDWPLGFLTLEGVGLYILYRHRSRGGVKPLWCSEELRSVRTWLLLGAAVGLCVGANLLRIWLMEGGLHLHTGNLAAEPGPVRWGPTLAIIAAASVLAPVAEEWFFRGILQEALTRRWGPAVSIPATALLFGMLHGLSSMWVVTVYGLVFGLLAHQRNSLTLSVLVHVGVNLVALGVPLVGQVVFYQ